MTQPSFLDPSGPVGAQREWQSATGLQRAVLGASGSVTLLSTDTNVRYVDPGGNDGTGTGSRSQPFRTVQPAINACIAAGASLANPFLVRVSPGAGFGSFKLSANIYVQGSGRGEGSYNGTPLTGVTFLAPNAAQSLDATFAGAVVASTGIFGASFTTAFLADFNAIGSAAASTIILQDIVSESAISCVGSGNLEYALCRSIYLNAAVDLTMTNMGGSQLSDCINDFVGRLVITQSAAIQGFHLLQGCSQASLVLTWTSAAIANVLTVIATDLVCSNGTAVGGVGLSITGAGVSFNAPAVLNIAMPDAAARLAFGNVAAAGLVGINGGTNIVTCTPTANRVLTIDPQSQSSRPTTIIVRNRAAVGSGFNVDLTLNGLALASGSPTYVPPGGEVTIRENFIDSSWTVTPYAQRFQLVLTNGVSASTPADVSAAPGVGMGVVAVNASTALGQLTVALTAGTRAGAGRILITSKIAATLLTQVGDQSTVGVVLS